MLNEYLIEQNTALNEGLLELAALTCNYDLECIYKTLINSGLDNSTLGFWIWDIPNNIEIYSPTFRDSLGFNDELDFPNIPESWQKQITKEDFDLAMFNFTNYVETEGKHQYIQKVIYNRKVEGQVDLLCHGKMLKWIEIDGKKTPGLMLGVHMSPDGKYIKD